MAQVKVEAIDAVIGGNELTLPDTWVTLQDATTGYNGPGSYHIQLSSSGGYVVTQGLRPADSGTLMTIARVVLTPSGATVLTDKRVLNVGWVGVNATVMQTANADGSYLASGVVTERTILGGISKLLDSLGTAQGDILFRGALGWEILSPGTAGYFLKTNGSGADPAWAAASGGGGGSTGSCTESTQAATITATQILASNSGRLGVVISNRSAATLFLGADSSTTTAKFFAIVQPNGQYVLPVAYTGAIWAIWDSAPGGQANIAAFPS